MIQSLNFKRHLLVGNLIYPSPERRTWKHIYNLVGSCINYSIVDSSYFGQKLEIPIIVNRKYPHKPTKLLHATKYVPYYTIAPLAIYYILLTHMRGWRGWLTEKCAVKCRCMNSFSKLTYERTLLLHRRLYLVALHYGRYNQILSKNYVSVLVLGDWYIKI